MTWEGFSRKRSWPILRYCPGIRLQGLRKTMKDLNQESRSPGPRFEPGIFRIRSGSANHDVRFRPADISSSPLAFTLYTAHLLCPPPSLPGVDHRSSVWWLVTISRFLFLLLMPARYSPQHFVTLMVLIIIILLLSRSRLCHYSVGGA
jgi:hypothetical protein